MFEYQGIKINYKDYGNKDRNTLVFLHGWGQNIKMMEPIANPLENSNRIIIIDLPGFGQSEEPKEVWHIEDFADMVYDLLKHLNITDPSLIGHSFGGKISIAYASKYKTKKLVLLASPYKASNAKISWKVKMLKKLKNIPGLNKIAEELKKNMGSTDYRNASIMMRKILVKHVNTDLTENVKKIKCPTLVIWGTNDADVNVECAYDLEKLIPDCGIIIYDKCTHYAYLENLNQVNLVLNSFFK